MCFRQWKFQKVFIAVEKVSIFFSNGLFIVRQTLKQSVLSREKCPIHSWPGCKFPLNLNEQEPCPCYYCCRRSAGVSAGVHGTQETVHKYFFNEHSWELNVQNVVIREEFLKICSTVKSVIIKVHLKKEMVCSVWLSCSGVSSATDWLLGSKAEITEC